MESIDVISICKALGDVNRLEIVQMLSDGGKMRVQTSGKI